MLQCLHCYWALLVRACIRFGLVTRQQVNKMARSTGHGGYGDTYTGQEITSTKHHTLALAGVPLSLQTPPTCRVSTATPNLGEVPPAEAGVAIGRSMGDRIHMDDPNMERTNNYGCTGGYGGTGSMGLEGAGLVGGFKMPPLSEEEDRMLHAVSGSVWVRDRANRGGEGGPWWVEFESWRRGGWRSWWVEARGCKSWGSGRS